MSKRFVSHDRFSDLNTALSVVCVGTKDRLNSKTSDKIISTVKAVLTGLEITGVWQLHHPTLLKNKATAGPKLELLGSKNSKKTTVTVSDVKDQPSIPVLIRPYINNPRCCYKSALIFPPGASVIRLLEKLQESTTASYEHNLLDRQHIGDTFLGTVVRTGNKFAFITISPDNPNKTQDGFLASEEFSKGYTENLSHVLAVGQYVYVEITHLHANGNLPSLSRANLLPDDFDDTFNPLPNKSGEASFAGFCDLEERVLIALEFLRQAIDTHTTKENWQRLDSGGVYLNGPKYAYAPCARVNKQFKESLCKYWKVKKIVKVTGIMKEFAKRKYLLPAYSGTRTVGYHLFDKAYSVLNKVRPTPPPYYEPKSVPKKPEKKVESPKSVEPPTPIVETKIQSPVASTKCVSSLPEISASPIQCNTSLVTPKPTLEQQIAEKTNALKEITLELSNIALVYDNMLEQRDELKDWLEINNPEDKNDDDEMDTE